MTTVRDGAGRVAWQNCIECRKSLMVGESAAHCTVCRFINQGIEQFIARTPELAYQEDINISRIFIRDSQHECFTLSSAHKRWRIGFFITPDVYDPILQKTCRRFVRIPPASLPLRIGQSSPHGVVNLRDRVNLAREWLKTCQAYHVQCKIAYLEAPKRLLQLDAYEQDVRLQEDVDAKIYDATNSNQTFRYACLSHCWGSSQPLRTTKANIKNMKDCIPWQSLPRTFQDAVTIARALDFPYLWCDSLCIVQDSEQDWSNQSQQMASIYGSATLTISASKASDSSDGFLDSSSNEAIAISTEAGTVWVREMRSHPYGGVSQTELDDDDEDITQQNPLDSRAWAFQEHLLSRRSLIFGRQEMFWLCRARHDCECGAGRSDQSRYHMIQRGAPARVALHERLVSSMFTEEGLGWSRSRFREFAETWNSVVEHYTSRRITMEKDRLIALGGVISKVAETVLADCHAGHWRAVQDRTQIGLKLLTEAAVGAEEFAKSLCWQHSNGRRSTVYRAPTWSWASLESDRGISHAFESLADRVDLDFSIVKIVDVCCPPVPSIDDPDFSKRVLTLETFIYRVSVIVDRGEMGIHCDDIEFDGAISLDCREEHTDILGTADLCCLILAVYRFRSDGWLMFDDLRTTSFWPAVGLMCRPSSNSPGHYERIGLWIAHEAPEYEPVHSPELYQARESGFITFPSQDKSSARKQISLI